MTVFKKALWPLSLGLVAVAVLTGCNVRYSAGYSRYYGDRVWHGDPFCRYSWDYGCGYRSSYRVGYIYERRHGHRHHGRRGHHAVEAMTLSAAAERPTTWQKEFNMSDRAVQHVQTAFDRALKGDTSYLLSLGVQRVDLKLLGDFQMPGNESLQRVAGSLGMKQNDLRDFLDLYMSRLAAALEEGRS